MAGERMEPMPMSPGRSPGQLGHAAVRWLGGRRGRVVVLAGVLFLGLLGLTGVRHSETISSKYQALSETYHLPSWRPHLPNLPSYLTSPLKPSNTTIELESGELDHVPSQLNKATPNFHLIMTALSDDDAFCKSSLSAMLLNYPPPTVINLFQTFKDQVQREKMRLKSLVDYLNNEKLVSDRDLVLIVNGHDTWFQLPSDVMIRQYRSVIADANKRLLSQYGLNADKMQKFNQTIVFGAEKKCEGEDLACRYVADSILPHNMYGKETGSDITLTSARYLDAGAVMGPAKDLKKMFGAAVKNFDEQNSQAGTVQSVLATMFGEQELARTSERKASQSTTSKWVDWFIDGTIGRSKKVDGVKPEGNSRLQLGRQYEYSIGLDYTHTLFQPFVYAAEDELVPLPHDNSTDLSIYRRADTPTPALTIPTALQQAKPPFWTADLSSHNPSPNEKSSFIEPLAFQQDLDDLKPRDTSWSQIKLIQNTYTGAVPVALHLNLLPPPLNGNSLEKRRLPDVRAHAAPRANITWYDLWYTPYSRALLRKYFRSPQSPIGYHKAAVGGDEMWDVRGGRGGVWTEREEIWLPWGEVDGVCGTVDQLRRVFEDDKGVWLHEHEGGAETERRKQEEELKKKIEEAKQKAEEQKSKDEEDRRKHDEDMKHKQAEAARKQNEDRKKAQAQKESRRWVA
ncbi:hypothetical protein CC78DRAFT_534573 [Lojkania enalia]|uniref:Uncharacterized protein n=1 Tax=Lojkania enalia TaxID=147567 RepID=A0A9P4K801_9PLEO|nr:hypothetical protein CC78DRAFT_534573 [Didymosphaeria enalia]